MLHIILFFRIYFIVKCCAIVVSLLECEGYNFAFHLLKKKKILAPSVLIYVSYSCMMFFSIQLYDVLLLFMFLLSFETLGSCAVLSVYRFAFAFEATDLFLCAVQLVFVGLEGSLLLLLVFGCMFQELSLAPSLIIDLPFISQLIHVFQPGVSMSFISWLSICRDWCQAVQKLACLSERGRLRLVQWY